MKTFEYKVLKLDIRGGLFSMGGEVDAHELEGILSIWGIEGWELVNTVDTSMGHGSSRDLVLIMKREKRD